ncbi:MAG: HAD hydrolase family protein [Gammaproteobacteria bacterium]
MTDDVPATVWARAAAIELAVFDVDGVLTDGRIILGPGGEEYKAFDVRDGLGMVRLRNAGVVLAIITGRSSAVVTARMRELGIGLVHQGVADKGACLATLQETLAIPVTGTCYLGDDLPDLAPMAQAGLAVAVGDACPEVRARADWTTRATGGRGAARELCELILAARAAAPGTRA